MKNDDEVMLAGGDKSAGFGHAESAVESSRSLSNQALDEMIRNSKNATNSGGTDQSGRASNQIRKSEADLGQSGLTKNSDGASVPAKLKDGSANSAAEGQNDRAREGRDRVDNIVRPDRADIHIKSEKDGVATLPTGDKLVKDGDREILFTPSGDKLSIREDGSFELKSKGGVEVKKQGDQTTVKFANGDEVTFSKRGITSVNRDGRTVDLIPGKELMQKLNEQFPHAKPGFKGGEEKQGIYDDKARPGTGSENRKNLESSPENQGGGSNRKIETPNHQSEKQKK